MMLVNVITYVGCRDPDAEVLVIFDQQTGYDEPMAVEHGPGNINHKPQPDAATGIASKIGQI